MSGVIPTNFWAGFETIPNYIIGEPCGGIPRESYTIICAYQIPQHRTTARADAIPSMATNSVVADEGSAASLNTCHAYRRATNSVAADGATTAAANANS